MGLFGKISRGLSKLGKKAAKKVGKGLSKVVNKTLKVTHLDGVVKAGMEGFDFATGAVAAIEGLVSKLPMGAEFLTIAEMTQPELLALKATMAEGQAIENFVKDGKINVKQLAQSALSRGALKDNPRIANLVGQFDDVRAQVDKYKHGLRANMAEEHNQFDYNRMVREAENHVRKATGDYGGYIDPYYTTYKDSKNRVSDIVSTINKRGRVNIDIPNKIKLPDFSKITIPRQSAPKLSDLKLSVPKLSVPKLSLPQVPKPSYTVPKIEVPQVPKLSVPKIDVPQIELPRIPRFIRRSRR